jgi:thioesterase domain-containing protein
MDAQKLELKLHQEIPLSRFMQVKVVKAEEDFVELECELSPNHNHLGTAFGGSLSCLMILAAYCKVFQLISETGHVVLKSNSSEFFLPVQEKLRAICRSPNSDKIEEFLKTYQKKNKARLTLESHIILHDGKIACSMTSEFVGVS